jgi:hypothetical protein
MAGHTATMPTGNPPPPATTTLELLIDNRTNIHRVSLTTEIEPEVYSLVKKFVLQQDVPAPRNIVFDPPTSPGERKIVVTFSIPEIKTLRLYISLDRESKTRKEWQALPGKERLRKWDLC